MNKDLYDFVCEKAREHDMTLNTCHGLGDMMHIEFYNESFKNKSALDVDNLVSKFRDVISASSSVDIIEMYPYDEIKVMCILSSTPN